MKKLFIFLAVLASLSIFRTAFAQTPTPTINGAPPPFTFTGSGVSQIGNTFTFSTGSGTFNALSGDAISTATGGATTVVGVNGTLLSGLPSGFVYNTTGTGVPSKATAAQLGTLVSLPQYSIPYSAGTTSALTDVASPTVNGVYALGWTVTGSAALAPAAITLGTAALDNTGTSGATIPLLNGANTYSAIQTFGVAPILTGLTGYVYANGSSQVGAATTIPLGSIVSTAGTLAPLYLANATSGLITLEPATGAITSYTIQLPVAQPSGSNTYLSCTAANPSACTWAAGGAVWPTVAGIPYWTSGTAWGGAYNSSTPIPANYLPVSLDNSTSVNGTSIPASATLLTAGGALGTPLSGNITNLTGTCTSCTASSATTATTATNATNIGTTTKSDNTEYYLTLVPANSTGNQAAVVVAAHYNASTNMLTLPAGGSFASTPDGTHAAIFSLYGNTANPAIPSNTLGFLGPTSATFTSVFYQLSTTAPTAGQVMAFSAPVAGVSTQTWITPGGSGTVTVVSSGALTSTALVTGGGTTTLQTPSATSTLDGSGNLAVAAGGSLGSADTGAPKFTFAANKATFNQPLYLGTTSNQLVFGTSTNLTTASFGVPSGAVTLTFPITTEYMVGANSDTTTTHVLHATGVAGVGNFAAIAASDLPAATTSALGAVSTGTATSTGVSNSGGAISVLNWVQDVTFTVSTSTTINANSCSPASSSAGTSVTMTGLVSTQALAVTPNADITNTTGWGNPAAGVLYITVAPGSGAFTYHVCNNTASNITTNGAATFNVAAR